MRNFVTIFCFLFTSQILFSGSYGDLSKRTIDRDFFVSVLGNYEAPGFEELVNLCFEHITLVEDAVLVKLAEGKPYDSSVRLNGLTALMLSSKTGRISKQRFLNTFFELFTNSEDYILPSFQDFEKNHFISIVAKLSPADSDPQSINESFTNLLLILDALFLNKFIANEGILNSLKTKIETAMKDIEKSNRTPAINKLSAAISEIIAQNGKHIKKDGVSILVGFLTNLIAQIKVTP